MSKRRAHRPPSRRVDRVRRVAVLLLESWLQRHRHVEDLVDQCERRKGPDGAAEMSYPERRRLRELVFGPVRLRGRYDHLITHLSDSSKPPKPRIRALFWMALHEILEMRAPGHATVDQAVELARVLKVGWATGWVNASLRRALREDPMAMFPSREEDPIGFATSWLSHPRWLVERWADLLGTAEMLELCAANNERPVLHLRARPGRRGQLRAALAELEWEARELELAPDALELVTRVPPSVILESIDEVCSLQDGAAQLIAPLLAKRMGPGVTVLDLCAAPGGKATHLAQLLDERSRVVAGDPARQRLLRMNPALERLGLGAKVSLVAADGMNPPFIEACFDGVLVDAPCTGTGVLSRRHEARWHRRAEDLEELPILQARLLDAAIDLVKPGGVVVYATCSLESEENDEVVDRVLAGRDDVIELGVGDTVDSNLRRGDRLQTWPHRHQLDGAFAACLQKIPSREATR